MGIGGVTGIGRIQNYNLQVPDDAKQPVKKVITEDLGLESQVVSPGQTDTGNAVQTAVRTEKTSVNAALEDISVTFNKQDDFGYIGRDSDIHSLDVEKAISDMRKDQILQQYQYFVGSKTVFTE